jgi:DNA end-binding protein Ku
MTRLRLIVLLLAVATFTPRTATAQWPERPVHFEDIADVKLAPDMRKLAEHILETEATDFDPSKFVDRYENAVVALLKEKQAGILPKQGPAPVSQPRVVDLMDALRRSIGAEAPKKPAARATPARRRKRA